MRSVDQTAKTLVALAKTLADNESRMTELERERLNVAVFKTLIAPDQMPFWLWDQIDETVRFCKVILTPEQMSANGHNQRRVNADTISNS